MRILITFQEFETLEEDVAPALSERIFAIDIGGSAKMKLNSLEVVRWLIMKYLSIVTIY